MKKMKYLILALAFVLTGAVKAQNEVSQVGGLEWYTNLDLAHEAANKKNVPIFGFFTGSDWCGWCIKLQREVFAKPAFVEWANENVILLELDFPKRKQLSQEQRVQNQNLQQALGVAGYPTIWLFKSSKDAVTGNYALTKYGRLGYPSGAIKGKEELKFLADAEAILAPLKVEKNAASSANNNESAKEKNQKATKEKTEGKGNGSEKPIDKEGVKAEKAAKKAAKKEEKAKQKALKKAEKANQPTQE
jgi:protein disulfide-isomerase